MGCGFSPLSFEKIKRPTTWCPRCERFGGNSLGKGWRLCGGKRKKQQQSPSVKLVFVLKDWGLSTVQSLFRAKQFHLPYPLWASGGVRSGLDVAKLLAMGADKVGVAFPFLQSALKGKSAVLEKMEIFERTLKILLFCTGSSNLKDLRGRWQWKNQWKNQ